MQNRINRAALAAAALLWIAGACYCQAGAEEQDADAAWLPRLAKRINAAFPGSTVHLAAVDHKLLVHGTAASEDDRRQIIAMVRTETTIHRSELPAAPKLEKWADDSLEDAGFDDAPSRRRSEMPLTGDVVDLLEVPPRAEVLLDVRVIETGLPVNSVRGVAHRPAAPHYRFSPVKGWPRATYAVMQDEDIGAEMSRLTSGSDADVAVKQTIVAGTKQPTPLLLGADVLVSGVRPDLDVRRGFSRQMAITPAVLEDGHLELTLEPCAGLKREQLRLPENQHLALSFTLAEGEWLVLRGLLYPQPRVPAAQTILNKDVTKLVNELLWPAAPRREDGELIVLIRGKLRDDARSASRSANRPKRRGFTN